MHHQALAQVCYFLTGDSGAWNTKDLRDLASLQATCKDAREICARPVQTRKPAAQAYRTLIQDLAEYHDLKVNHARDSAREDDEDEWEHPFTGEVHSFWLEHLETRAIMEAEDRAYEEAMAADPKWRSYIEWERQEREIDRAWDERD